MNTAPEAPSPVRLTHSDVTYIAERLADAGIDFNANKGEDELTRLRAMYEPYAQALATFLMVDMPPWYPEEGPLLDNWEASAWEKHDAAKGDFVLHPSA
jgi:hypothetical protein